jgi:hypothetical protein
MVSRFGKTFALALALIALAGGARDAAAQSWAVTAYLGYYYPLGDVLSEADVGENVSQQSTVAFGGRIARMFSANKLGVEFSLGYAGSGLEGEDSGIEIDGSLTMWSLRLIYMLGAGGNLRPYLAGGLGYVTRGGDAWEDIDGTGDIGGNLAVGLLFPLGETLNLRVELEDYLSSAGFESGGVESESEFQNDFLLSVGIHIPFGGN